VRAPLLLALSVVVVACAACIALYRHDPNALYLWGDAASHVVKARQFTDAPPIDIYWLIGSVWLQLPHLLLAPAAAVDGLFYGGTAGAAVGIPLLAGTGALLCLMVSRVTGMPSVGFLMAAAFALNPNVVYMSLTPMEEPSFLFFVTLGAYMFYAWLQSGAVARLSWCAVSVALATLCRYEAWPLAILLLLACGNAGVRQWRSAQRTQAFVTVALGLAGCLGIVTWLLWHVFVYGSPLEFTTLTRSALGKTAGDSWRSPLHVLEVYSRAVASVFGPASVLAAAAAFVPMVSRRLQHPARMLLLFLVLPPLFALASLLAGYVAIDEWWWNWRYTLSLGLFLTVAGGIGLAACFKSLLPSSAKFLLVGGLLAMPIVQLSVPSVGVATYNDAAKCIDGKVRDAIAVGDRLRQSYRGGTVVLLLAQRSHRIKIASGVHLENFVVPSETSAPIDEASALSSAAYAVIDKTSVQSRGGDEGSAASRDRALLNYLVVLENDTYILLGRSR